MAKTNNRITAKAIKEFREGKKFTKAEMSRRLGTSASHYLNIEAGRNAPSYRVVTTLYRMGLDLTKLIEIKNDKL